MYKVPSAVDLALLVARFAGGAFMLTHGIPKIEKLQGGNVKFISFLGLDPAVSLGLAIVAEVVCAFFLLVGFASRLSAAVLAFTMMIAAFVAHAGDPFKKMETSLLYLALYLIILFAGAGRYSIDALISRKGIK